MKNISFSRLSAAVLATMPFALMAQTTTAPSDSEGNGTVRIAVEREVNGVSVKMDTTLILTPGTDINEVLEQLGLGAETDLDGFGEDLEIIINKRSDLNKEFQELRLEFNEIIPDLRELQSAIRGVQDQIVFFQAPESDNRAFLGVYFDGVETAEGNVAKITDVIKGTGAEQAGLQIGDQIIAVNGQRFAEDQDLRDVLQAFSPGDEVELLISRGSDSEARQLNLTAVLGTPEEERAFQWQNEDETFEFQWDEGDLDFSILPFACEESSSMTEEDLQPFLGVYLDYASGEGVHISGTIPGTTAEELGLEKGDVIYEINEEPVADIAGLKEVLSHQNIGESIEVHYLRDGKKAKVKGTLKGNGDPRIQSSVILREGMLEPIGSLEEMIQQEVIRSGREISKDLQKDLEQLRALENLEIFFSENPEEIHSDLLRDFPSRVVRRVAIFITMDNLSAADLEQLNQHAEPKVTAQNDLSVEGVYFSPNPNDGQFVLNYVLQESGPTQVQLYDMNGRQVFGKAFDGIPGTHTEQINISEEPKGVYFLIVVQNGKSYAKKVVIQ